MYIIVKEEFVPDNGKFHEKMPDGRLIMDISEFKMLGSVPELQTVATAKELKALIEEMKMKQTEGYKETMTEGKEKEEKDGLKEKEV